MTIESVLKHGLAPVNPVSGGPADTRPCSTGVTIDDETYYGVVIPSNNAANRNELPAALRVWRIIETGSVPDIARIEERRRGSSILSHIWEAGLRREHTRRQRLEMQTRMWEQSSQLWSTFYSHVIGLLHKISEMNKVQGALANSESVEATWERELTTCCASWV